jgi:hypothetical protein
MWRPDLKERGRRYFIVRYGIIGWGVPTTVIGTMGLHLWRYGLVFNGPYLVAFFIHLVLAAVFVGLIGGYLWGSLYWKIAGGSEDRSQGQE